MINHNQSQTPVIPQFNDSFFSKLKTLVLAKAKIKVLTPNDCNILSIKIETTTAHKVSEITLKRFFGFVPGCFQFAAVIVNALCVYCGYSGWEDFFYSVNDNSAGEGDTNNLHYKAYRISKYNLQKLQSQSGIPYQNTIRREFLDRHMDKFLESDCRGTILSSPSGMGKTIGLCHWVQNKLNDYNVNQTEDIVLFINLSNLNSAYLKETELNNWILSILGRTSNVFNIKSEFKYNPKGTRFILIIDGLDEDTLKGNCSKYLLAHLSKLVTFYKDCSWFKLVVSMRTSALKKHCAEVEYNDEVWFNGIANPDEGFSNVPSFNEDEIKLLSSNINPQGDHGINVANIKSLNNPSLFELYYKQYKSGFSLAQLDRFVAYNKTIYLKYEKVYLGEMAIEKKEFIDILCDKLILGKGIQSIAKPRLLPFAKQVKQGYQELLSSGYIVESNGDDELNLEATLGFCDPDSFSYNIAKRFLEIHSNELSQQFADDFNTKFESHPYRLDLFMWCLFCLVKSEKFLSYRILKQIKFNVNDQLFINVFLSDMLSTQMEPEQKTSFIFKHFNPKNESDQLLNYFIGIEFQNAEYKKLLLAFVSYKLCRKEDILLHTALAIYYINELDMVGLENEINYLKKIDIEEVDELPIKTVLILDTFYYFLKYGIIKREGLANVTQFLFTISSKNKPEFKHCENYSFIFILAAWMLSSQNIPKTKRLFHAINHYNIVPFDNDSSFQFFVSTLIARSFIDSPVRYEKWFYQLFFIALDKAGSQTTPYMAASSQLLKIQTKLKLDEAGVDADVRDFFSFTTKHNFKLFQLYGSTLVLRYRSSDTDSELYRLALCYFTKITKEQGVQGFNYLLRSVRL